MTDQAEDREEVTNFLQPSTEQNATQSETDGPEWPELKSNIFSRLIFDWVTPLIRQGYKNPLQIYDIWQLKKNFTAKYVRDVFLSESKTWVGSKRPTLYTLHAIYGAPLYIAGMLTVVSIMCQLVAPLLLSWIIAYFEDESASRWLGLAYAAALGLVGALAMFLNQHQFLILQTINCRVRSTLVSAVYEKALRLSNKAKKKKTNGEIVNLMSIDAQKFAEATTYFHMLWSGPLQIVFGVIFLVTLIGWSCFVGLLVTIVFLPIQALFMKLYMKFRKKCLEQSDSRVKITSETLNGIKIIKMFVWEKSFIKTIMALRAGEVKEMMKNIALRVSSFTITSVTPMMITIATFATYVSLGGELTPDKVFPTLALFKMLQFPLSQMPIIIGFTLEALVSLRRLQEFFNEEEMEKTVSRDETTDVQINAVNCDFQWNDEEDNEGGKLKNVNLHVSKYEFIAIVGKVGAGKSSLLSALIGEMVKKSGELTVNGSVAYAPQIAWIQNCSLRDNILFGREFDSDKYWDCVRRSGLLPDLDILPDGDMTEIGEKGINLSGGQRQRVSLARCIYSEPEILLLDDPLSAVDAHVGKHIFENCIVNRPCARVLVTHQLQYLKYADRVYVMSKGEIIESGSFDELMSQENGELKRMIGENMVVSDVEQVTEHVATEVKQEGERVASPLMQEEERESGSTITLPLLKSLVSLMGGIPIIVLILFAYIATQTASIMTDFVLAQWTSGKYIVVLGFAGYLALYGGMGIFTSLLTFIRDLSLLGSGMRLSYKIHGLALERVLAAPMSFFDTTPLGRMLSRFSKDQENVDNNMFLVLAQFIQGMVSAALTFVLITVITPWFIIPLLPTLVVYIIFQQLFHKTTREVKRLDSLYRSPLYAHFSESLSGITTIRAFDDETRFKGEHMSRLDITQRLFMTNIMCQRWVAIRLEFLGHILVACSAVAAVLAKGSVEAALLALALTNSMQVTSSLAWSIRMSTEVENSMNNYERLYHYTKNIPNEGLPEEKETDPSWPTHGKIRFQNAVLRYRPDLPAVLRGVDFTIKPGEHVGVVGRTGAGKTSIMMALYRLYELTAGRIQIDDVDISRVTLENLRNHLSIIPQEPILFQGTIRSNLDPFNEYDDHQVWKALEKSHMKEFIESDRLGSLQLLNQVNEGGENLSVGQRQLLCLARALLRQSKILVLDEATASVDLETDALIQQTIRVEFKHCTRLTIAHRINTIIDSDKLLVMDKGEVVEFDTPKKLIQRPNGVFASIVQGTGEQNAKMLTNIALGAVDVDITELLRADHTDELQKLE